MTASIDEGILDGRLLVLDTETTGLSAAQGHRIVEIGLVELVDGLLTGREWHSWCNPGRAIDREAQRIHGLTEAFLRQQPTFDEVAKELVVFLEEEDTETRLVAHNAPFDLGFLNMELSFVGLPTIREDRVIDTLQLARRVFPGQRWSGGWLNRLLLWRGFPRCSSGACRRLGRLHRVFSGRRGCSGRRCRLFLWRRFLRCSGASRRNSAGRLSGFLASSRNRSSVSAGCRS